MVGPRIHWDDLVAVRLHVRGYTVTGAKRIVGKTHHGDGFRVTQQLGYWIGLGHVESPEPEILKGQNDYGQRLCHSFALAMAAAILTTRTRLLRLLVGLRLLAMHFEGQLAKSIGDILIHRERLEIGSKQVFH